MSDRPVFIYAASYADRAGGQHDHDCLAIAKETPARTCARLLPIVQGTGSDCTMGTPAFMPPKQAP